MYSLFITVITIKIDKNRIYEKFWWKNK